MTNDINRKLNRAFNNPALKSCEFSLTLCSVLSGQTFLGGSPHHPDPLKIWPGLLLISIQQRQAHRKKTAMAFYIIYVTCYLEVTPQLVFVAELFSERVQEKLICILASE